MILNHSTALTVAEETNRGFWSLGPFCFFDKIECLQAASKRKIKTDPIRYHYFDHVFQGLDWSQPPAGSLADVYRERAQQLRDKYDHIVMMYSGGSDSENMLHAFLSNNIRLDEIYCFAPLQVIDKFSHTFNPNDTSAENLMFEFELVVKPRLKEIAAAHPEIKITIADTTNDTLNLVQGGKLQDITTYGNFSPYFAYRKHLFEYMQTVPGNACCLTGNDKPAVIYHPATKNFSAVFRDSVISLAVMPEGSTQLFNPHNAEMFYYSKDCPKVWQKQCFAIKEAAQQNPMLLEIDPRAGGRKDEASPFFLYVEGINLEKVIYPDIDIDAIKFQAAKPTTFFYSETSTWFLNPVLAEKRTTDYYNGQVKDHVSMVADEFVERKAGQPSKFLQTTTEQIFF